MRPTKYSSKEFIEYFQKTVTPRKKKKKRKENVKNDILMGKVTLLK